ncbi:MAG: hypothetical protein NT080_07555 [Spirochaetes bacterium]|nr:hypothetical protein [Spirochaetota bacterium]
MRWIFGFDGGGTNSRLAIETLDGERLFYAESGSTNPRSNPMEKVRETLAGLFSRAYGEAGIDPRDCAAGFAGSAGVDAPEDGPRFANLLREAAGIPQEAAVAAGNDAEPALAGALRDTEGLLLIAGTGAIAFGRVYSGRSIRIGGWGHLLGDEGSAYWVAFQAISRGIKSREGRDFHSGLIDAALAHFGLASPFDFIELFHERLDKREIARFAPVVGELRDRADPLAADIFNAAARELALLVRSAAGPLDPELGRKRLAYRGGFIENDHVLRARVSTLARGFVPGLEIVEALSPAVDGACLLARAMTGSGRPPAGLA